MCRDAIPFVSITLAHRAALERIRLKYKPQLSDYSFSLLYCWKKDMKLSLYLEKDMFCIKGADYYFMPVGEDTAVRYFLETLLLREGDICLRFCDNRMTSFLAKNFGQRIEITAAPDDSDYLITSERLCSLPGSGLRSRRNAVHHYERVVPTPILESITPENLEEVRAFAADCNGPDALAMSIGLAHFFELEMQGILVRRSGRIVSLCTVAEKTPDTLQGQFLKSTDTERGAALFAMQAGVRAAGKQYRFVNMEDDMGVEGIRQFKRSLGAAVIPSYTVKLLPEKRYENIFF